MLQVITLIFTSFFQLIAFDRCWIVVFYLCTEYKIFVSDSKLFVSQVKLFISGQGAFCSDSSSSIFFYINHIDFLSAPKSLKRPYFDKNFCAAGKFLKNMPKRRLLLLVSICKKLSLFSNTAVVALEFFFALDRFCLELFLISQNLVLNSSFFTKAK